MNETHPYTEYEKTWEWDALSQALDKLIENRDLVEQTDRRYIVGYLCKTLAGSRKTNGTLDTTQFPALSSELPQRR